MASETTSEPRSSRLFHCSFCAKAQTEVVKLIGGPGVLICNECVERCVPLIAEPPHEKLDPEQIMTPERMPAETLLTVLAHYNDAFERIDAGMQDVVDVLRERDMSWASIGEALGVSRQAAWKRFG